jgi:hypothetical protein
MDPRYIDLIARWENLGWLDKKRICWISFWSVHRIDPQLALSIAAAISVSAVLIGEPHQRDITGLLSVIALIYFYSILALHFINWEHVKESSNRMSADGLLVMDLDGTILEVVGSEALELHDVGTNKIGTNAFNLNRTGDPDEQKKLFQKVILEGTPKSFNIISSKGVNFEICVCPVKNIVGRVYKILVYVTTC